MKSTKRITSLVLITPLLLGAGMDKKTIYISSDIISCPTPNENQSMRLFFTAAGARSFTLKLNAYNNKTNALTYTQNYEIQTFSTGVAIENITLPFKNRINGDGLKIEFVIIQGKEDFKYSGVLFPYVKQSINVSHYRHEPYVSQNSIIKFDANTVINDEYFDFTNLNEYLSLGAGNTLDLNNITFNVDKRLGFVADKIKLHIKDYANIFTSMNRIKNLVELNMDYTYDNGEVSLHLNEQMYVNKKTLEMSATQKEGFELTDKLYLPVGKESLFEEDEIYISISGGGYSKTDITMPFSYFFDSKEVGQCYESDYCISGGIREWFLCSFSQ